MTESLPKATVAELAHHLEGALAQNVFSAASLWVGNARGSLTQLHVGEGHTSARYDLASLTKPMATASIALKALQTGAIDLEFRLPQGPAVHELLSHRGGLAAHLRFGADWDIGRCQKAIWDTYDSARPCTYSDLGYIVLGWFLESALGAPLQDLAMSVSGARFHPLGSNPVEHSAIATGHSPLRGTVAQGDVHDDNCWVLGGVAGHAGLFGTAEDVGHWAQRILGAWRFPEQQHGQFAHRWVREFVQPSRYADGASWVLGFDTPTPPKSSAGQWVSPRAVGHLGFTGTSVWIDPDRGLIVVLLTNRVFCRNSQNAIKTLRPKLHDTIFGNFVGSKENASNSGR